MNIMRRGLPVTAVILSLLFCAPNNTDDAGNSSQTGNPIISGRVLNHDSTLATNAVVSLVPVDYVPSIALLKTTTASISVICTTNSKGEYRIYSIDSNCYNMEASRGTCGAFRDSVEIVLDSQEHHLDDMVLCDMGRITGITHMPGQNDTNQVRVTLYMPGTRRITKPVIGGRFLFDLVPAGSYQLIIDPTFDTYNVKILDITLSEGQVLDLDTIWLVMYEPDTIVINQSSVAGTWGPGKVYKVLISASIPSGQTLTILPGTKVNFYADFYNSGRLFIQGKEDSLITLECPYSRSSSLWNNSVADTGLFLNWATIKDMHYISLQGSGYYYISNCAFVNCTRGLYLFRGATITNCVFWKNNSALGDYNSAINGVSIINCIFLNNTNVHEGYSVYNGFTYCLFYNNQTIPSDPIEYSFFSDPLFASLDTLNPDFHLQTGSPCLGTGLNGADIGLYDSH